MAGRDMMRVAYRLRRERDALAVQVNMKGSVVLVAASTTATTNGI